MASTFIDCSNIERLVWHCISDKLFNKNQFDIYTYITVPDGKDHYDVLVQLFKKPTEENNYDTSLQKTFIIEIKVRETHYDALCLERYKYNQLKKISETSTKASILYICTTPKATYCFNLSSEKVHSQFDWFYREQNKSTVNKHKGTLNKSVTDIPVELAFKTISLTTADLTKMIKEKEEAKKAEQQSKQVRCLFESVFGIKN